MLALHLPKSRQNAHIANCCLHGSGETNGEQRRTEVSFDRIIIQALELLRLPKRHISGQSNVKQWRNRACSFCHYSFLKALVSESVSRKSRHTVVCCAAQENGACTHNMGILTQRTKYYFTCICSSVISWPNKTEFAVQVLAYLERTRTKSEVNHASCSWNIYI